jgi:AmmeMemoRadiSam system protein B
MQMAGVHFEKKMNPSQADNTELIKLVFHKIHNHNYELANSNFWKNFRANVFVTAYTKLPAIEENVWFCYGAGDMECTNTVEINAIRAVENGLKYDTRQKRSRILPRYFEATIIGKLQRWSSLENLKQSKHKVLFVLSSSQKQATFLPSVWNENTDWSAEKIVRGLNLKAGIMPSDSNWNVAELDNYVVEAELGKGQNNGLFQFNGDCARQPRFAGQFYPQNTDLLRDMVLLATLRKIPDPGLKVLFVPHAGIQASWDVAGAAYSKIHNGYQIECVVVLGTGHYLRDNTGGVMKCDIITPLGRYENDKVISTELLNTLPELSPQDDAREHSIEVQVPFLQTMCPRAKIVPIIVKSGSANQLYATCRGIIDILVKFRRRYLFVASGDMIHSGLNFGVNFKSVESIQTAQKPYISALENMEWEKFWNLTRDSTVCGRDAFACGILIGKIFGLKKFHIYAQANSGPGENIVMYLSGGITG